MPYYRESQLRSYRREHRKSRKGQPPAVGRFSSCADFCEVTIDASFRDKSFNIPGIRNNDTIKVGGAGIVANRHGFSAVVINGLDDQNINNSAQAELINAIVTLEILPHGQVWRLVCDAESISKPMDLILKEGRDAATGLNGHHRRLVDAMARHPELKVECVPRKHKNIRIADAFAKCAARNDMDRLKDEITARIKARAPRLVFTGRKKEEMQAEFIAWPAQVIIASPAEAAL
jgi:hypothetical protein